MKIKKAINIPSPIVEYTSDGTFLYTLFSSKSSGQIVVFYEEAMEPSGQFEIPEGISSPELVVHDDYIYTITGNGITGYDGFSGDPVVYIDSGSCVPLTLSIKDEVILSFCGIPLVGKNKIDTGSMCICSNDISTGKKIAQSASMEGQYQPASYGEDDIWVTGGLNLYKFKNTCELLIEKKLQIIPEYPITLTDNYAVSGSTLGTLEIFRRKDTSQVSRILVEKNSSSPVSYNNDHVVWITGKDVYLINLLSLKKRIIARLEDEIKSSPVVSGEYLYASSETGNLFRVNIETGVVENIKLSSGVIWKPIISKQYIFVATDKILHQVEI